MTHHEPDTTTITMALELLTDHGFEGIAPAFEILLNEAMRLERWRFHVCAVWPTATKASIQRHWSAESEASAL